MWLTKVAQAALLNDRVNLFPTARGLFVKSNAEEPVALLVSRAKSNGFASDVEIDEFIFGEVGGEATTGRLVLIVVFEADCVGVLDFEVGEGQAAKGSCREEDRGAHCDRGISEGRVEN